MPVVPGPPIPPENIPFSPCSMWTDDASVRACCGGLDPAYDLTDAIQYATEILWRLSGKRWPGLCERTVHPCSGDNCGCHNDAAWNALAASDWHWQMWPYPSFPMTYDGGFVNCWQCGLQVDAGGSPGCCEGRCNLPCLDIPGPIVDITEVVLGGVALPSTAYTIKGHNQLCRIDGGTWPCFNDFHGPACLNADETIEVSVDATGGTWDIIIDVAAGQTTITVNATDAANVLQAAIDAVYGAGASTVTGGPGDAGATNPYTIVLSSSVFGEVPTIAVADVNLSGGGESVLAVETVPGCISNPNSWFVTYTQGAAPPPGGQYAAAIFACQIALARCGGDDCVLPQRLKQIVREGVTMDFADPLTFLEKGQVGIYEVDLWLHSVNPNRITRRAAVYRADAPEPPANFS